jgi:hypothetical protein
MPYWKDDKRSDWKSVERYLARIGILREIMIQYMANFAILRNCSRKKNIYNSCCVISLFDPYEVSVADAPHRASRCEAQCEKTLRQASIRYHGNFQILSDLEYFGFVLSAETALRSQITLFPLLPRTENQRFYRVFDCWKMHSGFTIFTSLLDSSLYCLYATETIEKWYSPYSQRVPWPPYIESIVLGLNEAHRFLVLPWFDRLERMIFWKYLTEFYSSLTEFYSKQTEFYSKQTEFYSKQTEFYSFSNECQFSTLIIFIHVYL